MAQFVCFALLVKFCLFKRHIMTHLHISSTFAITKYTQVTGSAGIGGWEISSDERRAYHEFFVFRYPQNFPKKCRQIWQSPQRSYDVMFAVYHNVWLKKKSIYSIDSTYITHRRPMYTIDLQHK